MIVFQSVAWLLGVSFVSSNVGVYVQVDQPESVREYYDRGIVHTSIAAVGTCIQSQRLICVVKRIGAMPR